MTALWLTASWQQARGRGAPNMRGRGAPKNAAHDPFKKRACRCRPPAAGRRRRCLSVPLTASSLCASGRIANRCAPTPITSKHVLGGHASAAAKHQQAHQARRQFQDARRLCARVRPLPVRLALQSSRPTLVCRRRAPGSTPFFRVRSSIWSGRHVRTRLSQFILDGSSEFSAFATPVPHPFPPPPPTHTQGPPDPP